MAMTTDRFFVVKAKLTPCSNVIRDLVCTSIDDGTAPYDRSFVVQNVPPLINVKNLKTAFELVAPVQNVIFSTGKVNIFDISPHFGYNKAIVTFAEAAGLTTLKEAKYDTPITLTVPLTDARLQTPMDLYVDQIKNRTKIIEELSLKSDEIVSLYDEEIKLKTKIVKSSSGEVDEEGWQLVRRSRPDSLNREKALMARMRVKEEKKKRIEANVARVYQYRMRNEKLGKLRLLRQKFEADKFKLAQMKAGRKFRPN